MTRPRSSGKKTGSHRGVGKLSEGLEKRLVVYAVGASAAGAGLLGAPQPVKAEVVFTRADFTLNNGQLPIDLNHDGINDFVLTNRSVGGMCCFYTRVLSVRGNVGNGVGGPAGEAAALALGAVIGPADQFQTVKAGIATAFNDSNSFFFVFGAFANKTDRFLGLKFKINGQTHYGWAGFSIVTAGFSGSLPVVGATLRGYAYETVPNKRIRAGRTEGATAGAVSLSSAPPTTAVRQPATLGLLALGSGGLEVWRKEDDV